MNLVYKVNDRPKFGQLIVFALLLIATMRVGYVQLVKGEEYKDRALSQQTTDIVVEAERGIIYGTGVYQPGEVKATAAFKEAYQMGRSVR